ncbi:MAG: MFS transporter [Ruminococcaceae bacterium]|nr:MFS transporter [Oscillospiraceae bacterium]
MATILLIIIYIAFIGLGTPDSLFGTAWPAIYGEFSLPFSYASIITLLVTCSSMCSTLFSTRLIARYGTGKVTALCTALTVAALLGHSMAGDFLTVCLLSIPMGLGAGAVDTGLNNYVALHYSSTQMSLLHCFFGVGISISPYIMSRFISTEAGWRGGYRIAFFIQLAIALILVLSLPLWKKVAEKKHTEEVPIRVLSIRELARIPGVKTMWMLFLLSCAIEYTAGSWGSTYLVEAKGLPAERAAEVVLFYYIGMTLSRLLSGILATKLTCWQIIRIGMAVLGAAVVLLLLPVPTFLITVGVFMIGFGNGPMFPNFSYLTPINFGQDISQSVMGTQIAASSVGIMVVPAVCGLLGQAFGMEVFPMYLALLFGLMTLGVASIQRSMKAAGKDIR